MLLGWTHINPGIFVVDNASTTPFMLPPFCTPKVTLIASETNRGYSGGNNIGIEAAIQEDFEYVLLLNTDVQVDEAVVESMMRILGENINVGAVGPALLEGNELHIGGRDIGLYQNTRMVLSEKENGQLSYIPGTIFLTRGALFKKMGLLDEQFFFSGEMADFCKRIIADGQEILIDSTLRAIHKKTKNERGTNLSRYYSLRNRFLYLNKHHRNIRSQMRRKWIVIGLRQLMGALVHFDLAQVRIIYYALLDGLKGRFGNMNHRFIFST